MIIPVILSVSIITCIIIYIHIIFTAAILVQYKFSEYNDTYWTIIVNRNRKDIIEDLGGFVSNTGKEIFFPLSHTHTHTYRYIYLFTLFCITLLSVFSDCLSFSLIVRPVLVILCTRYTHNQKFPQSSYQWCLQPAGIMLFYHLLCTIFCYLLI